MKTIYIPKGETVSYETLATEHLVVKGCLQVTGSVKAKTISGDGVICAGSVEADIIRIGSLEAAAVICKRLIAECVQAPEVFASESAAVSCFLSAAYVETGRLTVAISEISEVKADEVINLTLKKRGLFTTLLLSALRSVWLTLTVPKSKNEVMDAEYAPAQEPSESKARQAAKEASPSSAAPEKKRKTPLNQSEREPVDEELNRIIGTFMLLRDQGYTLRVIPKTPEENAPVFDFETETIIRPAA